MSRRCDGTCDNCSEDCFYGDNEDDGLTVCEGCGEHIPEGSGPLMSDDDDNLYCTHCTQRAVECGAAIPNPELRETS